MRVLGFLALALVAAGCNCASAFQQCQMTCNGCCTMAGTCEAGTSKAACGELGALCVQCEIEEVCMPSRCVARPAMDAGKDAGTDAGVDAGPPSASFVLSPMTPMFAACATRDLAGAPLADVFPDVKLLNLVNVGNAAGTPQFTLTGAGAEAFTFDAGPMASLAPDAGTTLEVRFAPPDAGVWIATLSAGNASSTLAGSVLPNPPTPQLQVAVVGMDGAFTDCPAAGPCQLKFAPLLWNETASLEVRVTNLGCPTLKITGAQILPAGGAGQLAFALETPAIAPTVDAPLALTVNQAMQTTKLKIRFAPTDDGSGMLARGGVLRLVTNDRSVHDAQNTPGNYDVALSGTSLKPSVVISPAACAFSDSADTCGNATKQAGKANFVVTNDSTGPILIDSTVFRNAGSGGRFAITAPIAGMVIGPAATLPLEVTHTAMPLFVQDQLIVSASVPGQDAGTAGRAFVNVSGGVAPCLSTVPSVLDFQNPSAATTTKIITVRNGMGCGTLVLDSVRVDPNPYFTLFPPLLQPGMTLAPGVNVDATVKYTKPASGGTQVGTFRIQSNDPLYQAPTGRAVPLYSQAPIGQLPVAVLKACNPNDTACATPLTTVSLAALPNGPVGFKLLTLEGSDSYDPPGMATKASSFQFQIVAQPGNALVNPQGKQTTAKAVLTLDTPGLYRLSLNVWDAGDQKCAAPAFVNLTVTP